MRLTLSLSALLVAAGPAQAGERRYAVTDYDRVVVEGPYQVRLTVGAASNAVASGTPRALDEVTVDVQNRTLRIRHNAQAWGGYPGGQAPPPATITLTTRTLRTAALLGAGTLDVSGARGLRVEFLLAGSGRLAATGLDADALSLSLRGSGTMQLAGRGGTVAATVEGSASVDGTALLAQTLTLSAATSGDVRLTAARTATVDATGLGRVIVSGAAACTVNGPHAGEVSCGRAAR